MVHHPSQNETSADAASGAEPLDPARAASPSVRIKGLVAAANQVQRQLTHGIDAGEAEAFRRRVTELTALVEAICRDHGCAPAQLPGPSCRAYAFLKSLDLEHLPQRQADAEPAPRGIRISNLSARCAWAQHALYRLATQAPPPAPQRSGDADTDGEARVLQAITSTADEVDAICRDTRASPADLPTQSRRAYQWLRYLSDADNFAAHLATLALLRRILDQADWAGPDLLAGRAVRFELFHTDMLYRIDAKGRDIVLTAAQGFAGAPPEVLEALLKAALQPYAPPPVRRPALAAIKAYAASEDFAEVTTALELLAEPSEASLRGRHYDLAQVFDRVNAACFDGRMPRPNLTWSRALTARKLGHYYPAGDTVMLSRTLDDPRVPQEAIDLVMYHELLHKQLGVQTVNGRRYAHTEAFRQAEQRFAGYAQAKAGLGALAAGARPAPTEA